jgi:hypothetical protein
VKGDKRESLTGKRFILRELGMNFGELGIDTVREILSGIDTVHRGLLGVLGTEG